MATSKAEKLECGKREIISFFFIRIFATWIVKHVIAFGMARRMRRMAWTAKREKSMALNNEIQLHSPSDAAMRCSRVNGILLCHLRWYRLLGVRSDLRMKLNANRIDALFKQMPSTNQEFSIDLNSNSRGRVEKSLDALMMANGYSARTFAQRLTVKLADVPYRLSRTQTNNHSPRHRQLDSHRPLSNSFNSSELNRNTSSSSGCSCSSFSSMLMFYLVHFQVVDSFIVCFFWRWVGLVGAEE